MSGKQKPLIRFKGFTEAWEQRKLSYIYQNIGNAFVGTATPYYVDVGHFYLESNNIKDGKINRNNEIFINDEFYEKQKDKWLHTGDMVMVQSGHVGHTAVIPEELNNSVAHALIMFRNPKVKIDPYFLNYQYQTINAKKKIDNITTGNTIKHILASDIQNFTIDIPKIEEQQKIADYFLKLDYLITLHQRKLNLLKQIKKAMEKSFFIEKYIEKNRKESQNMTFKYESDFEEALIKVLSNKGWEKEVIKYPTEKDLLKNWAKILFDNNRGIDRLNNYPLTDEEMQQILEQINSLRTPIKLNTFINGKTISIKRDNPDDVDHFGKEVSLKIYDRREIAAGQSRYQIVQQPVFPRKSKILNDR